MMFTTVWFKLPATWGFLRFYSLAWSGSRSLRAVVTDKLGSHAKLVLTIALDADHRLHKGLKNRMEDF
ncbi:MAG: hypothetical protein O9256_03740 [Rhizobiaceae bacterium]|nr:hypothetical protein [Rhizobiaceae bacterium]